MTWGGGMRSVAGSVGGASAVGGGHDLLPGLPGLAVPCGVGVSRACRWAPGACVQAHAHMVEEAELQPTRRPHPGCRGKLCKSSGCAAHQIFLPPTLSLSNHLPLGPSSPPLPTPCTLHPPPRTRTLSPAGRVSTAWVHASHVLPPPSLQPSLQKGPFPDRPDELGGDIEFAVFASDPPLLQEATVLIRSRRAVLLGDLGFKQSDGLGLPAVMEFATAQLRVRGTCWLGVCAPVAMLLRQGVLGLWRCEQPGVEDWAIVHPLQATCLGRPARAAQHLCEHAHTYIHNTHTWGAPPGSASHPSLPPPIPWQLPASYAPHRRPTRRPTHPTPAPPSGVRQAGRPHQLPSLPEEPRAGQGVEG